MNNPFKTKIPEQTDFYVKINHRPGKDVFKNKSLFLLAKYAVNTSGLPKVVIKRLLELLSPIRDSSIDITDIYKISNCLEDQSNRRYQISVILNATLAKIEINVTAQSVSGGGVYI